MSFSLIIGKSIEDKELKIKKGSGIWGFLVGLLFTIFGLFSVMGLSTNPLDFPNAYRDISDAESIYIATTILLVGVLILLSYFVSRTVILSITGLSLLFYPLFEIFVVFDQIKEGEGGTNLLVLMMVSMVGGSILLMSLINVLLSSSPLFLLIIAFDSRHTT